MMVASLKPYSSAPGWEALLSRWSDWIDRQPPRDLFRINPAWLAQTLTVDTDLLVDAFLAGVLEGWFDLRWDYHCPHCDGIPTFESHLRAARCTNSCPQCQVDYRNQLDTTIEVTFSATARLSPEVGAQAEAWFEEFNQSIGNKTYQKPPVRLSGLDLIHRPLFHERFSDDVLSVEESLEIRNVSFLFTDLRGSTQLYESLGDVKAYALVRDHFRWLFEDIDRHRGLVIKTIGDAVMASFRTAEDALSAALAVQDRIHHLKIPGTDQALVVKMGIHAGAAIAVTLNDRFDYFGQTVNKAARIQSLAKNQEIFFSEAIFRHPPVRRLLSARRQPLTRWTTELKGILDQQVVYSLR